MKTRLFSVPAFRFAIGDIGRAIGCWWRGATYGRKLKDDQVVDFSPATLSQMVSNAEARGDKIAICQDHKSAFVSTTGAPAPSLGYFYALAVFDKGTLVKHWAKDGGAPPAGVSDDGQPRDGLYCRLGEITPLGYDAKEGLANFSSLSPMFVTEGADEQGNNIGYALFDFGATSTPFQAGCEIVFHSAPAAMAWELHPKVGSRVHEPASRRTGKVQSEYAGGFVVQWDNGTTTVYDDAAIERGQVVVSKFATAMRADDNVRCPVCHGWAPTTFSQGAWRLVDHPAGGPKCKGSGRADWISYSQGATMADDATGKPLAVGDRVHAGNGDDYDEGRVRSIQGDQILVGWDSGVSTTESSRRLHKMSQSTGAARAFGANMNPEMMAKLGLADGCSADEMKAAMAKYMADAEEKFKKLGAMEDEAAKKMAADADEKKKDDDDKDKAMTAMSAALAGLQAKVVDFEAKEAARAKIENDVREAEINRFADDAVKGGYPADARDALVTMARSNRTAAEKIAAPFIASNAALMGRVTAGGAPLGKGNSLALQPNASGVIKMGLSLSQAIKEFRNKPENKSMTYEAAAAEVARQRPDLATSYFNGQ